MEKLIDIVMYMHQVIFEAFGASSSGKETPENSEKLGVGGLALHYANVIHQIDNIVTRPASLPPNIRDTLYHGLPPTVKKALRSRLQAIDTKDVKDEMEKTLQWLVPVATNTTKACQGFGWVGEWANTGNEFGRSAAINVILTRLQHFIMLINRKQMSTSLNWWHYCIN
ncbi:Peptidyl-prolyl cis-trans isomerase family protein [Hibiscus syriacus]|uniref:Peptidyl-prolyl cis-trans isomerase family protein n=1 Tax=Hibiscus syriacus TaxID=106335 RepID=A0A6A3BKH6_HIBSY|nr:Peptidyl-prolyl cis-trans isomerase family protein [Hibiscus syriacus]